MQQIYIYQHTTNSDNSIVRLRKTKIITDSGEEIIGSPDVRRITPLDDFSDEDKITKNICNLIFTKDVKKNFVEYEGILAKDNK